MRHRIRFKSKRTPPPPKRIFVITLILFIAMVYISIKIIGEGIEPTLMDVANEKTTEFATRAINTAVRFVEDYDFEDVSHITYNDEGNVSRLSWDSSVISEINRVATDRVEEFFYSMNRGEMPDYDERLEEPIEFGEGAEDLSAKDPTVVEIPIGQATGNTILANLGPKVPVNMELIGSVHTDVIRESTPLGINGTFYSIYLLVEVDVQIIIPFSTDISTVQTTIDIDSGVITGEVPDFYSDGNNDPSISVPKDDIQGE